MVAMHKKKVVIIDDEEDLCQLMKAYLVDLNYDVFIANTLSQGISLMADVSPDVAFIDNNLPDGLGWEKMEFFLKQYPECKINLISAYNYVSPALDQASTVRIIEKPLTLNAIRQYL
jgi:two-component system, OmpR family, response regulator